MHEFMDFYRMDYTTNIFVNETNYQGNSERDSLSKKNILNFFFFRKKIKYG